MYSHQRYIWAMVEKGVEPFGVLKPGEIGQQLALPAQCGKGSRALRGVETQLAGVDAVTRHVEKGVEPFGVFKCERRDVPRLCQRRNGGKPKMSERVQEWAAWSEEGDRVRIAFTPHPKRYWPTTVLSDQPLPLARCAGRAVRVEGAGAMWMYAHVVMGAVAAGAVSVEVFQPQAGWVRIYPLDQPPGGGPCPWYRVRALSGAGLEVELLRREDDQDWDPALVSGAVGVLGEASPWAVYLTGRGANWMYGAVAAQVAARGEGILTACFLPRVHPSQAVIVHGREEAGLLFPLPPALVQGRPGLVLGVVGDPGSGKSVLAKVLNRLRSETGADGWVMDCDAASPTQNWFVQMCQQGQMAEGRAIREPQKRHWDHAMELQVAQQLANLRLRHDLVIADLPGGRFTVQPPLRIPPGREVIMFAVDRFIVLGRYGEETAAAWEAELAKWDLADRIIAVLQSRDPGAPPRAEVVKEGGRYVGAVTGLDRAQSPQALADGLRLGLLPLIKELVPARDEGRGG